MSMPERRTLRWLDARIDLTKIFSLITTFGLARGDIDPRKSTDEAAEDVFLKPHPVYVHWPYVLGILAFVLFIFQSLTGLLLAFYYQPTSETAYESTLLIIRDTSVGWYIYQMHHWGSHVLLGLLAFRMCHLFVHSAYKAPRELVWVCGTLLMFLALNATLTGSLLPWDQQAYWSVTRSLEIIKELPVLGGFYSLVVGGLDISSFTLTRFYVLHTALFPLLMLVFFYLHFATVRRIGPSTLKQRDDPEPLYPHHLLNLLSLVLLAFGLIYTLAVFAPAPFHQPADPYQGVKDITAPWYLLPTCGLIEFLPGFGGVVLLIIALGFVALPLVDRTPFRPTRQRPLALIFFAAYCLALIALGYIGYTLRG